MSTPSTFPRLHLVVGLAAITCVSASCSSGAPEPASQDIVFTGQLTGQRTVTTVSTGASVVVTCARLSAIAGTVTVRLEDPSAQTLNGTLVIDGTETMVGAPVMTVTPASPGATCATYPPAPVGWNTTVSGTSASLSAQSSRTETSGGNTTNTLSFSGTLSGDVITGTVTLGITGQSATGGTTSITSGSGSFSVTLHR